MIQIETYIFRVEYRNEEVTFLRKEKYLGNKRVSIYQKEIRPDKIPPRLKLVSIADSIEYSEYGGAVLMIMRDENNSVKYGISICSQSDKFDMDKGVKIAQSRLAQYQLTRINDNPTLPDKFNKDVLYFMEEYHGNKPTYFIKLT